MNRKTITAITISITLSLLLFGCQGMTALEKLNKASEKLRAAKSISMSTEISVSNVSDLSDISNPFSFLGQDIYVGMEAKYSYPVKNNKNSIKDIEMAVEMTMNPFGEKMVVKSYFQDGFMYMGIPSMLEELIRIDMDSPDYDEIRSSATSIQPGDLLIDAVDGNAINITAQTIDYMGNYIKAECIQLTITEENIEQFYRILGSAADTTNIQAGKMSESVNFDDFVYKIYIDNNNNILRFELAYGAANDGGLTGDTMNISMVADIYDVNDTTVDFPDFSEAIDYSDFK